MSARRRVELWVEARGGTAAVNPVMRALLDDLAAAGAAVSVRVPEHELIDPLRLREDTTPDLVLLKTATSLGLSLAVADEACGTKFLNGARETLRVHDKAATVARLAAAGLPVPETHLFGPGAGRIAPPGTDAAWVTKPTRGVHGRGVTVHNGTSPISHPTAPDAGGYHVVDDGTRLLQRYVGDGPDVKVYAAGESLFAGFKPFGPGSYATDDIEPTALHPATEEMVRAAGEALGLRLFGVDFRLEGGVPVIIDANPFPGYRGFPEAVPALRAEIGHALEEMG